MTPSPSAHGRGLRAAGSTLTSSRIAFGALLLRDLVVLRKRLREFIPRTIVQPLLLCFVFLYVFPTIGHGRRRPAAAPPGSRRSRPSSSPASSGSRSCSRASRPWRCRWCRSSATPRRSRIGCSHRCRCRWSRSRRSLFGAIQGLLAATIVFPIAAVVHASAIHINLAGALAGAAHADPARVHHHARRSG